MKPCPAPAAQVAKEPAPKKKAPKKKAPKKKAPLKRRGRKAASAVKLPKMRSPPAVRHEAGLQYRFDPEKRSVEWWWENHYKNETRINTFRSWASADRWRVQRENHWERVIAAVAREMAGEATKAAVDEAKQLVSVRKQTFSILSGVDSAGKATPLPEVKSYEGAVGALVKLDERVDKKREAILASLPVGSTGDSPPTTTGVDFSEEEYRAMATALIRERHALPAAEEGEE